MNPFDDGKVYRFIVKNDAFFNIREPHTGKVLQKQSETEFEITGSMAFNTVVKNLKQLSVLYAQHGFIFNDESIVVDNIVIEAPQTDESLLIAE